jgi:alpha-N-arabinofuranosidase
MDRYQNPIIKGFNPDPSICRVGGDFYLVTSTFEFFPGVPIFHSRNLVEWELINYCLTEDSQLNLENCGCSKGIFAPTIRYHDGTFFMITTNVSHRGNFIVHTKDIRGKWSEPHWIDHVGIDPSLLFDDDGRVYYCGTALDERGRQGIALFEINPFTGEKLSRTEIISYGAGGKHPEAPHLYKINGWYYLMIAEGGTEYGHMETIFRSRSPWGPYEPCPHNPILSHKDYMGSPIQATGHADLVEDAAGSWWLVCLAIRPLPTTLLHNLGRETFLAPVKWDDDGWPVVGNQGRIALEMEAELPAPLTGKAITADFTDDFDSDVLGMEWNFVRNPRRENYSLTAKKGFLRLSAGEETLNDFHPTFVGIRQKEFELVACAKLLVEEMGEGQQAGIAAYYNMDYHYEIYVTQESGQHYVVLAKKVHDIYHIAEKRPIDFSGELELQIETGKDDYLFKYRLGGEWITLGTGKTAGLCTEGTMTMTFTGVYLGLFASKGEVYFDYFTVKQLTQ